MVTTTFPNLVEWLKMQYVLLNVNLSVIFYRNVYHLSSIAQIFLTTYYLETCIMSIHGQYVVWLSVRGEERENGRGRRTR